MGVLCFVEVKLKVFYKDELAEEPQEQRKVDMVIEFYHPIFYDKEEWYVRILIDGWMSSRIKNVRGKFDFASYNNLINRFVKDYLFKGRVLTLTEIEKIVYEELGDEVVWSCIKKGDGNENNR